MINKIILTKKNILIFIILTVALFFTLKLKERGYSTLNYNKNLYNIETADNKWSTYVNKKYKYSFQYPVLLNFGKHCGGYPEGIVFYENNAAIYNFKDSISILIYNTNLKSTEEWLKKENDKLKNDGIIRILEKEIMIDSNWAIVTYLENQKTINDPHGIPYEKDRGHSKKTIFVKDGVLFEINTRFVDYKFTKEEGMIGPFWNGRIADHEHIWNSFKTNSFNFEIQELPQQKVMFDNWEFYINKEYNYSFNYPETAIMDDYCVGYPDKISFSSSNLNGYGVIGISVFKNNNFLNINDWLEAENKKFQGQHWVIEKNIFVGGQNAIMTYAVGNKPPHEEYKSEKQTAFLKDDKLFVIYTRVDDYEKVLNSFSFNE